MTTAGFQQSKLKGQSFDTHVEYFIQYGGMGINVGCHESFILMIWTIQQGFRISTTEIQNTQCKSLAHSEHKKIPKLGIFRRIAYNTQNSISYVLGLSENCILLTVFLFCVCQDCHTAYFVVFVPFSHTFSSRLLVRKYDT